MKRSLWLAAGLCSLAASAQSVGMFVDFTPEERKTVPVEIDGTYDAEALSRPLPEAIRQELDARFDEVAKKSGATGISAAVFRPSLGSWRGVAGLADVAAGTPVTLESRFDAGSIGKVFTAALVFDTIESERLTLDDAARKWYPQLGAEDSVTIDQLLTHTSGIYSFNWSEKYRDSPKYVPPARLIAASLSEKRHFAPGRRWSYTNTGYLMLAGIVAQIEGQPYETLLGEKILEPLGLTGSAVITPKNQRDITIRGYHEGNLVEKYVNYANPGGAGIIATTPHDLIRFFHALLQGALIDSASLDAMTSGMYPMGTGITWYGRGMIYMESPLGPMLYFSGRVPGFGAMVGYLIESKTYVSVMVNDQTQVDPCWYALLRDLAG